MVGVSENTDQPPTDIATLQALLAQARTAQEAAQERVAFLRMLGAGFGASLGIALWDTRQAFHDARISETVSAANLAHVTAPGLDAAQRTAEVAGAVMRQSFMQATDDFADLPTDFAPPKTLSFKSCPSTTTSA